MGIARRAHRCDARAQDVDRKTRICADSAPGRRRYTALPADGRSRSLLLDEHSRDSGSDDHAPRLSPTVPSGLPPDRGRLDGVSSFMGMRWEDPQTVRLQIRPELINAGGLLSGVVTYALVDYCMGSTLWAQTTSEERIATISISINYIQTATEGEIVCRTELDRRNRTTAVMRSEVRHEDGRLLVTAIGSYSIFPRRRASAPVDAAAIDGLSEPSTQRARRAR